MPRTLLPEWSPQDAVLLTWPHGATDWADRLAAVERVYRELAVAITQHERLLVACHDPIHRDHVRDQLIAAGIAPDGYRLAIAPSNDSWARDHGPITVQEGIRPHLLDFRFNGWGGKYAHELDDGITRALAAANCFDGTPCTTIDLILEGGGIETDGKGTLLTTRSCLLAATRNPDLSQAQLEARLGELLGIERFLWLHHGQLEGDDTDGHIDTLARFCDPHTIAYVQCTDERDGHYPALSLMAAELHEFRTADGAPYRLVPLPWPGAQFDDDGRRLPATYANFLIINGAVLVPTYAAAADAQALAVLSGCFPGREIIGIDCSALIRQNGSLHCVTMQLPRGVLGNAGTGDAVHA